MKLNKSSKIIKKLSKNSLENQASLFKCMGDPTCLKILYLLSRENEVCVSDIAEAMEVSLSAASHQLSKLKSMEILETARKGQSICYSFSGGKRAGLVRKLLIAN